MENKKRKLTVILPHPDDESFPMGGTLAKYAAEGTEITLICATLGEQGIPDIEPEQAALIRKKELMDAASVLGIRTVQLLGYHDGNLSNVDARRIISQLVNAIQRIRPQVVITFGPNGISGHPDHVAISQFVTTAFDQAVSQGIISSSAKLLYIAPSEATLQGCGVVPSQKVAGGPVASIDITDYRLQKLYAMQSHASQNPPFTGNPELEIDKMACHEYFALARPIGHYTTFTDLFAPLVRDKEDN